jgi:undecaprenyl phosphate-alpha-L-ara4FN deformylase
MFGNLFGFRPLDKRKIRKSIYQPPMADEDAEIVAAKQKTNEPEIILRDKFPFRKELNTGNTIGLRVLVDSRKAMENGVQPLLQALKQFSALSTFFIVTGKEGNGESLFSLLNPAFYNEIKRSLRLKCEGFSTAFSGLLALPRPVTKELNEITGQITGNGHDSGICGFSPSRWKSAVDGRNEDAIDLLYEYGISEYEEVFGQKAKAFAAPFFLCSNASIILEDDFNFDYASDCRGIDPFLPVIDPRVFRTPQVPVTLPTIREWLASGQGDAKSFYDHVLKECQSQKYPVLEISPLFEGVAFKQEFSAFLASAADAGFHFASLRELLGVRLSDPAPLPRCTLSYGLMEGRRRFVTIQMLEV